MKSKFTSIIMVLIIITIIGAIGLLGIIIIQETTGIQISDLPKIIAGEERNTRPDSADDFEPDVTNYRDKIEKNMETPEIRTTENPLVIGIDEPEEKEEQEQDINYDNIVVNKHFYSQLDEPSQIIYRAFEQNKENMKTGTYKVELGNGFSDILDREDGQDELGNYYQAAIEAYFYDNPDVFYLSANKMFLNIETTTRRTSKTYNVYIDCGEKGSYLVDEFPTKADVDQALGRIEEVRNEIIRQKSRDDYSNIKLAHDYLINNIEYDMSLSSENVYNLYGALVEGRCVCEGYAKAYKYLLDGLNIETVVVIGNASNSEGKTENHAWNYVKLKDNWYAVDTTWDDPVVIGGGYLSNESRYRYFLKGEATISENHVTSGRFTEEGKEFQYPKLSVEDY